MALTVAQYLVQPFFSLEDELPTTAISLLAAVFITGLTWLNCYSMKITTRLQNTFMVCKVAALILVIIVGAVGLAQGNFDLTSWAINSQKIYIYYFFGEIFFNFAYQRISHLVTIEAMRTIGFFLNCNQTVHK